MNPSVYLFGKKDDSYVVYLGEFSAKDGLGLLECDVKIEIEEFGANGSGDLGWLNNNNIPRIDSVGKLIKFLNENGDIDLVDLTIYIDVL